MALLQPEFSTGDILVVGDGNFSFSVCLARALACKDVNIFATSLDSRCSLEGDQIALENLDRLSSFRNVQVIHEVDGTNLAKAFPSRKFRRIIFNFPHVGGKSKINLARLLLERFFMSAAVHIDAKDGDICVSLCQGQGGTPVDNPARDYGNTWQVVSQAAKAGLTLSAVWPFQSAKYPHYISAGFRGKLGKGFHTKDGLTHQFVPGIPLDTIPDIQLFLGQQKSLREVHSRDSLHSMSHHPVCILRRRLECFFDHHSVTPFKVIDPELGILNQEMKNCKVCKSKQEHLRNAEANRNKQDSFVQNINRKTASAGDHTESGSETTTRSDLDERKGERCFYGKIADCLQNHYDSFIITDVVTDHSIPVSRNSYPISHKMAVVKTARKDSNGEDMEELKNILDEFEKQICPNIKTTCKQFTETCDAKEEALKLSHSCENIEKSKAGVSRCSTSLYCTRCTCSSQHTQCIYCQLEANYLGAHEVHKAQEIEEFIDPSTVTELYYQDKLLLTCGLLGQGATGQNASTSGWMIVLNLDCVVTAVCEIPDVRLLWSCNPKFLEQFKDPQVPTSECLVKFTPFSLHPTSFIHDISFWLTEDSTEKKFFEAIHKTTHDCVCDVFFRERYHDKEQDLVSYNYRMSYSRCDGPLTHMQAVEMQNLLRRYLMTLGFGLK